MRIQDFHSALIVKPSSLGDIVHTLPAVHALKAVHPQLTVRWIAKPEWMPLIAGSPDVDQVIPFPQKQLRGPLKLLRWARDFRAARPDSGEIVLDFQGLLRSAFIARSRGSRPVLGLSDAREGASLAYDQTVPVNTSAHAVDRYLQLSAALGADVSRVVFRMPEGSAPAASLPKDYIVLHPYSRGAGKSLSAEVVQALCAQLAPHPIVLLGVTDSPAPVTGSHVTDLVGKTSLAELIWLLRHARKVVSVDSGPMHMAAAVNDQTLGLHTWSDPRKVGPHNILASVWKAGRIAGRTEFSDSECRDERQISVRDLTEIVAWAVK